MRPIRFVTRAVLLLALLAMAAGTQPSLADGILITREQQARIDIAKEQLGVLKDHLNVAKDIPGLDADIVESLGKGAKTVDWTIDGLGKGVNALGLIEKLIKLHTTFACLQSSVTCMQTEGRTPGCIQAYAFGMSELFSQLHEALDGYEFDSPGGLIASAGVGAINLAIMWYTPALKVASETFVKATKWGRICKDDNICKEICSVEENRSIFDCAKLENEFPPMTAECETLKTIVEGKGDTKQPSADDVFEEIQRRKFRIDHAPLVKLEEDRKILGLIVKRVGGSSKLAEFNAAYGTVKSGYEAMEGLNDIGPAEAQLITDSCALQEVLSESFAKSLAAKQRFVSALRTVNMVGRCPEHGLIVARVNGTKERGRPYLIEH